MTTKAPAQDGTGSCEASQIAPSCLTCRYALHYRGDLERHGFPGLRVPAFVRMCWLWSGDRQATVQLVNTFWVCRLWEACK